MEGAFQNGYKFCNGFKQINFFHENDDLPAEYDLNRDYGNIRFDEIKEAIKH